MHMSRKLRRSLSWGLLLAAFAVWFVALRPVGLGGPASYIIVSGTSMEPTFHTGDLVVLTERASYRPGEVVTYRVPKGDPGAGSFVIHRIKGGSATSGFVTQGDNRKYSDDWHPRGGDIVGTMRLMVPKVGTLLSTLREPSLLAALAGGAAVVTILLRTPTAPSRAGARSTTEPADA